MAEQRVNKWRARRRIGGHRTSHIISSGASARYACISHPPSGGGSTSGLDERFPFNPAIGQFITMFYAVVDAAARELTYASAGHPGAIHLRRSGAAAGVLEATGMPIGLGEAYEQQVVKLEAGDRVYLYTDGVIEAMNSEDEQFGTDRLTRTLKSHLNATLQESISALLEEIRDWCGALPPHDDVSVLAFECA